jgi:hypothetical protein
MTLFDDYRVRFKPDIDNFFSVQVNERNPKYIIRNSIDCEIESIEDAINGTIDNIGNLNRKARNFSSIKDTNLSESYGEEIEKEEETIDFLYKKIDNLRLHRP